MKIRCKVKARHMTNINHISTKEMFKNTRHDILVHKGTYDYIYRILRDKTIEKRKFVSFSDGFPLVPMHADSVIVFDKYKLVKKGHNFLKIKYDIPFLRGNKEILRHLMENKSVSELKREALKEISEFKTRMALNNLNMQTKLNRLEEMIKSNPLRYFLEIFKHENEIIGTITFFAETPQFPII